MLETFSVCQFFSDESYEYVRRNIDAKSAVEAAKHYTSSIGAQTGTTKRVIITDQDDYCVFEWKFGEGVTFPSPTKLTPFRRKPDAKT